MKVIKKGIKRAILIYYDPEIKTTRRVVFGDPQKLIKMFFTHGGIILKRLQALIKENPKDTEQAKESIKETKEWFATPHGSNAGEDIRMSLIYEVKKVK